MVNVWNKKCDFEACFTRPFSGMASSAKVEFCCMQVRTGVVNFGSKRCRVDNCSEQPSNGAPGSSQTEYCPSHAQPGMVNVESNKCDQEGCPTQVSHQIHEGGFLCQRHALHTGGRIVYDARGRKRGRSSVGAGYGANGSLRACRRACRRCSTNNMRGGATPPPVSGLPHAGRASGPGESDADATPALVIAPPAQCSSGVRMGVKEATPFGSGSNPHCVSLNTERDDATPSPLFQLHAEGSNVEGGEIDADTMPALAVTPRARCSSGVIMGSELPIPFSSGADSHCTRTKTLCNDASSPPASGLPATGGNSESGESRSSARPALAIARSPCCTGGGNAGTDQDIDPAITSSSGSDPHCVRSRIVCDGASPPLVYQLPASGDDSNPGNGGPGAELASAIAPRAHCSGRVRSGAEVGILFSSNSDPHCVPTDTAKESTGLSLVPGLPTAGSRSGSCESGTDARVALAAAPAACCGVGVSAKTEQAESFSRGSNPHSVRVRPMRGDATLPSVSEVPPAGSGLKSCEADADAESALAVTSPARCSRGVSTGSEAANLSGSGIDRHFMRMSFVRERTMAPSVSRLAVAGSDLDLGESDEDSEVAIAPPARCSGGSFAVNQPAATFSNGSNIGASSNKCGNEPGHCRMPWPEPMVSHDTSRLSSLSAEPLSSEDVVKDTASAIAVTGKDDSGVDSTAEKSASQAMTCVEDLQRVSNVASTSRETVKTKLDLVDLASLVVEACETEEEGDGDNDNENDDEEDEGMDEDMLSRLASARKAAAVHFSSAAMVVLALAMASGGKKVLSRHGPGTDATSEASAASAVIPSGFMG